MFALGNVPSGFPPSSLVLGNPAALVASETPAGTIRPMFNDSAATGWILLNEGTIGDASSGASRANVDTWPLFSLLWSKGTNTTCPIQTSAGSSSTRGANAAADWAAHKRMKLPFSNGRVLGVIGTGSLTTRTLGQVFGEETHILTVGELASHLHNVSAVNNSGSPSLLATADQIFNLATINTSASGLDDPHNNMQPTMFTGWEIKL